MSRYFENFSISQYNNEYCRTLIQRTALTQDVVKRTALFFPYQAQEGDRSDTLSFLYYNDPSLDWLVFFANDIVDPYYGWHLPLNQFNDYITDKYGSLSSAQLKTHHYQVEWANDDTTLTVSAYNSLPCVYPTNTKKYWTPSLTDIGEIVGYKRKHEDTKVNTNRVMQIEIDPTLYSTSGFINGEIVSQTSGGIVTGYGEITLIESDRILVQHISGTFNTLSNVIGFDSQTQITPSSTSTLIENIPVAEQIYWRAITLYEYEEYLNEQRKVLKMVDKNYSEIAESNLKLLMKA